MKQNVFFGSIVKDHIGSWPYVYFLPITSLPSQPFATATWERSVLAQGALGELSALSRFMPMSDIALKTALLQEALASSRIEGTQASLTQVLDAKLNADVTNPDVEDVLRYHDALNFAVELLNELPISRRMVCATHKVLMDSRNGQSKTPGEFRNSPVWIGSPDSTPENARFIPPLPHHLADLFAAWEEVVNKPSGMLVALVAWTHYQFETIHPFLDGNGRMGRLLIEIQLIQYGVLSGPILGISRHIERYRDEYYEVLQGMRERGDFDALVRYFAFAIESQATETVSKVERMLALRDRWLIEFGSYSKSMPTLITFMTQNPILTVKLAQETLRVSQPTAAKLIEMAQELGVVTLRGRGGRGGKQSWLVPEVWGILSPHEAP